MPNPMVKRVLKCRQNYKLNNFCALSFPAYKGGKDGIKGTKVEQEFKKKLGGKWNNRNSRNSVTEQLKEIFFQFS